MRITNACVNLFLNKTKNYKVREIVGTKVGASQPFGLARNCVSEFRKLVCLTKDRSFRHGNETAKCHLVLKDTEDEEPGRSAPENAGCFTVDIYLRFH